MIVTDWPVVHVVTVIIGKSVSNVGDTRVITMSCLE